MQEPDSTQPGQANGARRVLVVLRRNLVLILVCVLLVPGAALGFTLLQDKEYEASASLLFRDPGLDENLFGSTFFQPTEDTDRAAATNVRLVALDTVATRTARALSLPGLDREAVMEATEVTELGQSDLIEVTAVDEDPATSARLANTFATEYIDFRREADRATVREAQSLVQERLEALTPEGRAGAEGQDLERSARELEILASLQTGNAELVQQAQPPTEASAPNVPRTFGIGLLLGLVLAVGLTFLREQLDRRLRDSADVRDILQVPVLAAIPGLRTMRALPGPDSQSNRVTTEAFLMLRTNLRYFNVDEDKVKSILVTSAAPQDGKTTVSVNLARAEASAGRRVLLIEADLRRPTIAEQLGIDATSGLTRILTGVVGASEAIVVKLGVDVITAGPLPPNPAEMIDSKRMVDLIRWGEAHYDTVIIDSPPTTVVADAIPLLSVVSGIVAVVRLGQSRRDAVERLRNQLVNTDAPLLGVVLNGSARPKDDSYYTSRPPDLFAATPRRKPQASNGRPADAADRSRA